MPKNAGFITRFESTCCRTRHPSARDAKHNAISMTCVYVFPLESPLKLAMTRLILALLANALSQDVVDPSGKVDLPHGSAVPMPSTSTPSPTEAEFVHEDKSDAEFDDVTWTSSLLLIGFVLTSMGILCLVNCFDKHIRKESWAFLSTTVSIFSAASFDFAVYRLLEIAIDKFGGHEHDSEHDMAKQCGIVIALSIWCLLVFLILHISAHITSEVH